MSATTSSTTAAGPGSRRRVLLIGLAVLAALIVISVLTRDDADVDQAYDPRNPGPDGAQAVARVLDQQGVDVEIARGQDALLDRRVDASTTVVVTNPEQLGESTADELRAYAETAGALVLVGHAVVLSQWDDDLETGDPLRGEQDAGCDLEPADGLVVRTYGAAGLMADGCFGSGGNNSLVREDDVWLWTSPETLTNDKVLEADNGALALRLLGQGDRVVWYVADAADTAATDGVRISALLPSYVVPALWLVFASVVGLVLWRGRRLGPLVTEPLPVVVRAAESTRSRGQMYHRTRDRQHAATVLVAASRRRIAELLRLPRSVDLPVLVAAAAARTGRDPRAVHDLLAVPLVGKDSQLVELGQRLTQLENEVRAP